MKWLECKNSIITGDMISILSDIPDNYFDLLLTDPPYGLDIIGQMVRKDPTGKYGYKQFEYKTWDNDRPNGHAFKEMLRVSKNQIIWGGNYFADLLPASQGWLVWNKGQRNFSLADGELAWTSFDKALRIFDYSRAQALKNRPDYHPTPKPLALIEWCLKLRAKSGDKILDCYSGSGTTAIACNDLGLDFLCIDIDPDYNKKAIQRLEDARKQIRFLPKYFEKEGMKTNE